MATQKIGIIDSGIGGLSLLKNILNHNLNAEYFYISDSENVPYGNKSQDFMYQQMNSMVQKLLSKKVDSIVIACNTATAETIDRLRENFDMPFFGIEPYINYLNTDVKPTKLALILTEATANSKRFKELCDKRDPSHKISIYPLPKLALIIERLKEYDISFLEEEIRQELSPLKNKDYSHLILGCTHYPIISEFIEEELNLKTVDPTEKIINHIKVKLNLKELNSKGPANFLYNSKNNDDWIETNFTTLNYI